MENAARILALGFNLPAGRTYSLEETDLVTLRLGILSTHQVDRPPNPWSAENLHEQLKTVYTFRVDGSTHSDTEFYFHYDEKIHQILESITTTDQVFWNDTLAFVINEKCDVKKIGGDGNCQFRTLSYLLFDNEDLHTQVRREVCEFIKIGQNFFEPYFYQTGNRADMNSVDECDIDGKWGNHITLLATALLYDLRILLRLVDRNDHYSFILLNKIGATLVLINFKQEFHYECLVPKFKKRQNRI